MSIYIGDKEIKDLYVGGATEDYSAMRGPCQEGFHVPTSNDFNNLVNVLRELGISQSNAPLYLKLPSGNARNYYSSEVADGKGRYWLSTGGSSYYANAMVLSIYGIASEVIASGRPIRPFKDNFTIPENGWTVILGSIDTGIGIFHNSTLGLISISSNGITGFTIADKNLGATVVWNNGDTLSQSNCGKLYQRGNNYGFAYSGTVTTSSTQVDASNYGPGNYYSSSSFITTYQDWSYVHNYNLRGGETGIIEKSNIKAVYLGENKVRPSEWKPNANTVAYRPLNSTTTNTDQSGNGYTLSQTGGSFTTLGNVSCFYNGGSTTGYFNLTSAPKIPSGNSARTISLWAYPTGYSSSYNRYMLAYGRSRYDVSIAISTSQKYTTTANSQAITGKTMPTNAWSLLTFVSSGNTFYLYANGALEGSNSSATIDTEAVSSSYPLRLMRQNTSTSSNYQFRGYLSEVIIEDKAWTADEIAAYYNQTKANYGLT